MFVEFINLKIEADTSGTPLQQYVIASYNSREKWIPRQNTFEEFNRDKALKEEITFEIIELDKPKEYCCGRLEFIIGFKFTDETIL